jgi:energy-coupling factor transporter ATP-binding protein EcfA2
MTGAEIGAAATVAKVVIEKVGPAGVAFVKSLISGKIVMVVGPPRAGKSTFVDYMQFGIFQHEQETHKTYEPLRGPKFKLRVGATNSLEVLVKTTVDIPGQYNEVQLANEVYNQRPHALVIVLDLSAPLHGSDGTADWLTAFCTRLDQCWQSAKQSRNRLRSVIVAMNKLDLVDRSVVVEGEKVFKDIVAQHFKAARGRNMDDVVFRATVMVDNPDGTKWVDAVLVDLAIATTRKR